MAQWEVLLSLLVGGKVLRIYLRLRGGSSIWGKDVKTRRIREQLLKTKSLWILSLLNWTQTPEDRSWKCPLAASIYKYVLATVGRNVSASVTTNILQGAITLQLAFAGCGNGSPKGSVQSRHWAQVQVLASGKKFLSTCNTAFLLNTAGGSVTSLRLGGIKITCISSFSSF